MSLSLIPFSSHAQVSLSVQTNCISADGTTNSPVCNGGIVTPVISTVVSNHSYRLLAKPAAGWHFTGWSGDVASSNASLTVQLRSNTVVIANFLENTFNPIKGAYYGLFNPQSGGDPVMSANSGALSFTITDLGAVSGKLFGVSESYVTNVTRSGGVTNIIVKTNFTQVTYSFSGHATNDSENLTIALDVPRSRKQPLHLFGTFVQFLGEFDGSVDGGGRTNDIVAYRAQNFSGPCPFAGIYTGYLLATNSESDPISIPAGYGALTVLVATNGALTLAGNLPDGTPVAQKTFVGGVLDLGAVTGSWPLYVPLGRGIGLLHGLISFGIDEPNVSRIFSSDQIYWIRPGKTAPITRLVTSVRGYQYLPPGRGTNAVAWTNAIAILEGGNITDAVTNRFTLSANNKVTFLDGNSNKESVVITPAKGTFTGKFTHPVTRRSTAFKGVLLQTPPVSDEVLGGYGVGWFLGTNQGGAVMLVPATP